MQFLLTRFIVLTIFTYVENKKRGKNMNVYVVTYNTNDNPDRRMIWSVRKNKADAVEDLKEIKKMYGSFLADTEISEHPLD